MQASKTHDNIIFISSQICYWGVIPPTPQILVGKKQQHCQILTRDIVQYNYDILHSALQWLQEYINQSLELTIHAPYLALTGKLWGMYWRENQPYHNSSGVGVTKAPVVNFSVSKMFNLAKVPVKILWVTFIFDRCHCSWAAATPIKYKCDIQLLICVLAMLKNEDRGNWLSNPHLSTVYTLSCHSSMKIKSKR